jgi:hypothetical protein
MGHEELGDADFDDSVIDDDNGEMPWESHAREAIQRALEQAMYEPTTRYCLVTKDRRVRGKMFVRFVPEHPYLDMEDVLLALPFFPQPCTSVPRMAPHNAPAC